MGGVTVRHLDMTMNISECWLLRIVWLPSTGVPLEGGGSLLKSKKKSINRKCLQLLEEVNVELGTMYRMSCLQNFISTFITVQPTLFLPSQFVNCRNDEPYIGNKSFLWRRVEARLCQGPGPMFWRVLTGDSCGHDTISIWHNRPPACPCQPNMNISTFCGLYS